METKKAEYVSNMVGIIPIQNGPANDGYPWPNALMPLYKNYTALHRSVLECAMAGCSSIWVIAEKKHIPLLKTVVGSFVEDPILAQLPVEYKRNFKMRIPIWYASVPVRDVGRRDCYGRSILVAAEYSAKVSGKLSKFAMPQKFYVSFPYTIFSPWRLQKNRKKIKDSKKNFYLTLNGKTVLDGEQVGFTFFMDELKPLLDDFKTQDPGQWEYVEGENDGKLYKGLKRKKPGEYFTAKNLTLDKVFRSATLGDAETFDSGRTHDITTWEGYAGYIASPHWYKMPKKISYFRFNKLKDLEERLIECGVYDDYEFHEQTELSDNLQ